MKRRKSEGEHEIEEKLEESDNSGYESSQISDESDEELAEIASGSKRMKKSSGPSAEEVQVARETAQLFKSNIFKMQVDELLGEIALTEKKQRIIDRCLFEINDAIKNVKASKEYSIEEVYKLFPNTPFCSPEPAMTAHYKLRYLAPVNVNVVGSYALRTMVKQPEGIVADMVVEMPQDLFDKKDDVNFRYLHKRAFYISYLKGQLQSILRRKKPTKTKKARTREADEADIEDKHSLTLESIEFGYLNNDPHLPIIHIVLDRPQRVHINVIPGIPIDCLDFRRLGPERNCVRFGDEKPTAIYNSAVLVDMSHSALLDFLTKAAHSCPAFRDACKLGRLWLRQRGFGASYSQGGFGHLQWAVLMAALLSDRSHVLVNGHSSYQLFRGTLSYIATKGIRVLFGRNHKSSDDTHDLRRYSHFPAQLIDADLGLNVAYNMSQWSLNMLQHEAAVTCEMLSDVVRDRFTGIFLSRLDDNLRFDALYTVSIHKGQVQPGSDYVEVSELNHQVCADYVISGGRNRYIMEKLYRVLSRGLDNRASQIWLIPGTSGNEANRLSDTMEVKVGAIFTDDVDEVVTRGPEAEDEKAAQRFRRFWGPKAELRRFADGSIVECVVWEPGVVASAHVAFQVVNYVCRLHLPGSKVNEEIVGVPRKLYSQVLVDKETYFVKHNAFEVLTRDISRLALPLSIKGVHGCSSSLRMTCLDPPEPFDLHGDDAMAEGVIEFETSFRWPRELQAVEQTKIAFLVKIAEDLSHGGSEYVTRVGSEKGLLGIEQGFLIVRGKDGFTFKLRIRTEKDVSLMEQLSAQAKDASCKEAVSEFILSYDRSVGAAATSHHRLIRSMALRYPAYGPSCRLFKLWIRTHLLGEALTEQMQELICLQPFLDSTPFTVPRTAAVGFYRVLSFIAGWNWKAEPLVLDSSIEASEPTTPDISGQILGSTSGTSMSQKLYHLAGDGLSKLRSSDPIMTLAPLYIVTPADQSGILWTRSVQRSGTSALVASRLTALALAAYRTPESKFSPSLDEYDFVIHIDNASAHSQHKQSVYKNLQLTSQLDGSQIAEKSINIAHMFFQDLVHRYKDSMVLFFRKDNVNQEAVIAGIWAYDVTQPRKFRVNLTYSTEPLEDGSVVVNRNAIIEELRRTGGDLVRNIVVK